jgi:hypothetical protein
MDRRETRFFYLRRNTPLNCCGTLFCSSRMSSNHPAVHAARRPTLPVAQAARRPVLCASQDPTSGVGQEETPEGQNTPRNDLATKEQAEAEGMRLLAVACRLQNARDEADSAHAKLQQALAEVEEITVPKKDALERPNQANAQRKPSTKSAQQAEVEVHLRDVLSTCDSGTMPTKNRDTAKQQVERTKVHLPTSTSSFGSTDHPASASASAESHEPAPNDAVEAAGRNKLAEVTNCPSGRNLGQQNSVHAGKFSRCFGST